MKPVTEGATAPALAAAATLDIVVPVLDDGAALKQQLQWLKPVRARGARVVVVDGGSRDPGSALVRQADQSLSAPRGRASQMNAGAAAGSAAWLLFLHADCRLPARADALIFGAAQAGALWGRFDVRIASRSRLLRLVAAMMNWRSRLSGICTGDQAMFVRRDVFERVGGFPDIALMEDIALSRALKRLAPPHRISEPVRTSARRWEHTGAWRSIALMWRLRAAYFLGADPAVLARRYGYRPRATLP